MVEKKEGIYSVFPESKSNILFFIESLVPGMQM